MFLPSWALILWGVGEVSGCDPWPWMYYTKHWGHSEWELVYSRTHALNILERPGSQVPRSPCLWTRISHSTMFPGSHTPKSPCSHVSVSQVHSPRGSQVPRLLSSQVPKPPISQVCSPQVPRSPAPKLPCPQAPKLPGLQPPRSQFYNKM